MPMFLDLPAHSIPAVDAAPASAYSHLYCSHCGRKYNGDLVQTWCKQEGCIKPLLAAYDFSMPYDKAMLNGRINSMWRYREMLPILLEENIVSLGEGMTPMIRTKNLARHNNLAQLWIKDESGNPTGSFKARGLAMAISKAKELGKTTFAIPTAGNAGGAMSAYCARAGLEAHVYMPINTPEAFKQEVRYFGAHLTEVDGNISDCAKQLKQDRERLGADWFDVSTLKEPFRIEGKKTMGYEIAEQMNWQLPDVIVYPTGGGTGLIGIWKAFQEMLKLSWIKGKLPRMVAVQTEGCCPIVKAFEEGRPEAGFFENAQTFANGLRVPAAFGDRVILKTLKDSNGTAVAVTDQEIRIAVAEIAKDEGMLVAPEGAATWAALKQLVHTGWAKPEEKIVLLNTGGGYKYLESL